MNWTEGSLARHSKGRHYKQEEARQREHFAKARSRHLGGALASASASSSTSAGIFNFVPDFILPSARLGQNQPPAANKYYFNINKLQWGQRPGLHLTQSNTSCQFGNVQQAMSHLPDMQFRLGPDCALKTAISEQPYTGASNLDDLAATKKRLLEKSDWAGIKSLCCQPLESFHQKQMMPVNPLRSKASNQNATAQEFTDGTLEATRPLSDLAPVDQRLHLVQSKEKDGLTTKSNHSHVDEEIKHFGKHQNIVA
ncbi:hypothetical protein CDD81_4697 [Ophiocordyceps australis]|uniref:Uncharacterized protein n=1 Tax=Ophiocordyceps australis TaxID=1399860 RepID=A0A2C5YA53_9HYPO|nr:hypothetical protein CDD81_4697 [Ophiocordyceps australis]